jgi:hypothetical protein
MNRPFFRDTSHLTEEQKCILALQQALEQEHGEHRIHELQDRLLKFSIMNLNVGLTIFEDEDEEDSYS